MAAQRRYEDLHKDRPYHSGNFDDWAEKLSLEHPFRYDDGVTVAVSEHDLTPDDDWLEQRPLLDPSQ